MASALAIAWREPRGVAAHEAVGSAPMDEHQQPRTPGALGCELAIQTRRELLTGIIGARRAWTVSMISVLSMPWR
jgi:hypothetical protein